MADKQALINFARKRAKRYGIDPDIFVAQIQQESGFKPQITSPAGAQGIAQIMPDTARGWGVDPNRPRQALDAAAKNMASYVKQYGGYENALRAYNAGPGNIKASHGFGETNAYVASILGNARKSGGGHVDTTGQQQAARTQTTFDSLLKFGQDKVGTKQSFDAAAFEQARKRALVGAFISTRRPGPVLAEVLPTEAPDPQDFIKSSVTFKPGKFGIDNQKNTTTTPAAGLSGKKIAGGKVVLAPGANRAGVPLHKDVRQFVKGVSALVGQPLTIGTGSNHSQLTVNGTESDHWRGEGADIPAQGSSLVQMGRAALIAAGMPRKQAMKATGGGYNVGSWQIIFNTNAPGWGDHTDHLHVGRRR
jgi:hypothetical protein